MERNEKGQAGWHLERVGERVEDGGQAAVADADLRLRHEALEPHLDGGHVDPNPAENEHAQIVKHPAGRPGNGKTSHG
jgi:hypothetical protein